MTAVVLAGGKGERLGGNTSKPMVEIGGKPVLEHIITQLKAASVQEVIIYVNHLREVISDYFGDGSGFGIPIRYHESPDFMGTAGIVKGLEDRLKNAPFYVVYGDCYSNYRLEQLRHAHCLFKARHSEIVGTIGLWVREDACPAGIATVDSDGRIERFKEKPKPEEVFSHLVNTAHYFFEPSIFDQIPAGQVIDFSREVFPNLAKSRLLCGVELTGWYRPYDTPELLVAARRAAESDS